MDSINIAKAKFEKAKHRRIRKITTLFRFVELFFLLFLICRFSVQIPFNFKISGEIFRRITVAVLSPQFVFIIGNAIVITLFLKSGCSGNKSPSDDFCAEYVENSVIDSQTKERENIVMVGFDDCTERKIYRSQSVNFYRDGFEKQSQRLRRSATERCRESTPAASSYAKEEMSGEEFRRAVEDFIAKQQRFLREEEFPDVVGY